MARNVRFIVLNADEQYRGTLRALLHEAEGVKIVAEVEEPALLGQALRQFPVDLVLVNLDPAPDTILASISSTVAEFPDLAFFAASESTDGQLILKTIRTGVREFLPKPIDVKAFLEAVDRESSQRAQSDTLGKLITVTGASGGVGSTIIATNLGAELAQLASGGVVIVDLDFRYGQVGTLLDVEPNHSIADLCNTPEELERDLIEQVMVGHGSGLKVLCRPPSLSQAETITAASCVGLLSSLLQFNEFVITDGPQRSDPSEKAILDISDINLLVVQLVVPTVRNAARLLDSLKEEGYQLDRVRLVLNRIGRNSGPLSLNDVEETLGMKEFASIPDDWPTTSAAINLGETLQSFSPKSKVRLTIQEIAERLHGSSKGADEEKGAAKKGLIGRILAH